MKHSTRHDLAQQAQHWLTLGLRPVPVATDGSKRPATFGVFGGSRYSWSGYAEYHNPGPEQIAAMFANDTDGIGLLCGSPSGHVEMLELEGRAVTEKWYQQLERMFDEAGARDLWARINSGWLEATPSGGLHLYYRVEGGAPGNTKLARRPSNGIELAAWKHLETLKAREQFTGDALVARETRIAATGPLDVPQVMIETRGEGGFSVCAPSAGRTHPSGQPWTLLVGGPRTIPTITAAQDGLIHALCARLDAMPDPTQAPAPTTTPNPSAGLLEAPAPIARIRTADAGSDDDELRPGDDLIRQVSWEELLVPAGWVKTASPPGVDYWVRPGKPVHLGHSATVRHTEDNFYVFSPSAHPFEPNRSYTKLGTYAVLHHGGDYAAAARHLRAAGFGGQRPAPIHGLSIAEQLEGILTPQQIEDTTMALNDPHRHEEASTSTGEVWCLPDGEEGDGMSPEPTPSEWEGIRAHREYLADLIEADASWEGYDEEVSPSVSPSVPMPVAPLTPPPPPMPVSNAPTAPKRREDPDGARFLVATRASEIPIRPVFWLKENTIALGTLCLLGGREGIGKSTVAYSYAADVTTGRMRGVYYGHPKRVIVAATEDSWSHTIVPRLMAAGADLRRVLRVDVEKADGIVEGLMLPEDVPALGELAKVQDAALIVLDPLMSRLGAELDPHKDAEVRRGLEPLVKTADEVGASVLAVIHVNKTRTNDPLTALMGSRAFVAVARSVLFVMTDPEDMDRRLIGVVKNNLAHIEQETQGFRFESKLVMDALEPVWSSRIVMDGMDPRSIWDAIIDTDREANRPKSGHRRVDEIAEWILEYLHGVGGSALRVDIVKAGKAEGFCEATMGRAKDKAGVQHKRHGSPPATTWFVSS